jgi:hypothetical protein
MWQNNIPISTMLPGQLPSPKLLSASNTGPIKHASSQQLMPDMILLLDPFVICNLPRNAQTTKQHNDLEKSMYASCHDFLITPRVVPTQTLSALDWYTPFEGRTWI